MGGLESKARPVTWLALVLNLLLAGFKLFAGWVAHSQAVIADGAHSLSDLTTDVALLIGMQYWDRPSDRSHPYGHRRIETLITALIGVFLAVTGLGLGYRAIATITEPHTQSVGSLAMVAALVSIVIKEGLFHVTVAVAKRAKSSALLANAWHHRSDAFSSLPTVLAVGAAMLSPNLWYLDHLGAIVVCIFILQAAWRIALPAASKLVDTAPPSDLQESLQREIHAFPRVRTAHAVRTRYIGAGVALDFHIHVDPEITVHEGHDIAEGLKSRLLAAFPDVVDVVIHIEPAPEEPLPNSGHF